MSCGESSHTLYVCDGLRQSVEMVGVKCKGVEVMEVAEGAREADESIR